MGRENEEEIREEKGSGERRRGEEEKGSGERKRGEEEKGSGERRRRERIRERRMDRSKGIGGPEEMKWRGVGREGSRESKARRRYTQHPTY